MGSINHLLLVCNSFPPNSGIGARRWAKLSKGLANEDIRVHVLKATNRGLVDNSWLDDVSSSNITTYEYSPQYPEVLTKPPQGLIGKIKYRIALLWMLLKNKGTPYDIGFGNRSVINKALEKLISTNRYDAIICTGAPFNLLYYTVSFNKKNRDIPILCDFRDPWLTASNYGMSSLSNARMTHERFKHQFVISKSDLITAPNQFLTQEIAAQSSESVSVNTAVLPHFYDPQDLENFLRPTTPPKDNTIRLIYGGSVYGGTETFLVKFAKTLTELKTLNIKLYNRLSITFYTPDLGKFQHLAKHKSILSFQPPIGKKIFKEVAKSDFVLIIPNKEKRNYLTTKFFEYLPFQLPLLHLGPSGFLQETIEKNDLGYCFPDSASEFGHILEKEFTPSANYGKLLEKHSLSNVTNTLISQLEDIIKD